MSIEKPKSLNTEMVGNAPEMIGNTEILSERFPSVFKKLETLSGQAQRYARAGLVAAGVLVSAAQYNEAQAGMDTESVDSSVNAEQTAGFEPSLSPAERLAEQQEYIGALQYALGSTESNNFETNVNLALAELEQIDVTRILEEVAARASDLESISPFTELEHESIGKAIELLPVLKNIPEYLLDDPDRIASLPSVEEIDRAYADALHAHAEVRSAALSEQAVAEEVAKLGGLMQSWDGQAEQPITPHAVELGGNAPMVGETPNLDDMTPDQIEAMANNLIGQAVVAEEAGVDLSRFAEGTLKAQPPETASESGLEEPATEIADVPQAETAEVPMHETEEHKAYIRFINDTKNLSDRFESGEISADDAIEHLRLLSQEARESFEFLIDKKNHPNKQLTESEQKRYELIHQVFHRAQTIKLQLDN